MFKKGYVALVLTIILGFTWVSAEYNTIQVQDSSQWYNDVILDNSLDFKAEYKNWDVYTSWKSFNKDEKFKWYKIVRSVNNSNPVYPNDWYIKYLWNVDEVKYIDYSPKNWVSYYRVCAITHENNRYCSNVVKVYVDKEGEGNEPFVCTMEYAPVCGYKDWKYKVYSNMWNLKWNKAYYKHDWKCNNTVIEKPVNNYWLSSKVKMRARWMINKLIKRIDSKWVSNDKKIEIIDSIISKLNNLEEKKPKLSNLLNYLIELLKSKRENYSDDFSEIEDIFNID